MKKEKNRVKPMENIWRFYNGTVSGIVAAESEDEAVELATRYLQIQFDDISKNDLSVTVWKVTEDDDFRDDFPFAVAVSY